MRSALRALALLEPVTLALLLANVFALHLPALAQVLGPVHGGCYLGIIVVALLVDGLRPSTGCCPCAGGRRAARRQARLAA